MTTHKALNLVWSDKRIRTAIIAFILPLFSLLVLERFSSLTLSIIYLLSFSALTFFLTGQRHYQYGIQVNIFKENFEFYVLMFRLGCWGLLPGTAFWSVY